MADFLYIDWMVIKFAQWLIGMGRKHFDSRNIHQFVTSISLWSSPTVYAIQE